MVLAFQHGASAIRLVAFRIDLIVERQSGVLVLFRPRLARVQEVRLCPKRVISYTKGMITEKEGGVLVMM